MKSKCHFLLTGLFLFSITVFAKAEIADSLRLKSDIEKLYSKGDIISINKIISKNTFLPVEYSYDIISRNIQKSKADNDTEALAGSYLTMGTFWARLGHKMNAYENFLLCENICKTNNYRKKLALVFICEANIRSKIEIKVQKYNEAIAILNKENDYKNLASAYLNLGYAYFHEKDKKIAAPDIVKKMQDAYTKAEKYNAISKDPEMSALISLRKAEVLLVDNQYKAADYEYQKSQKLYEQIKLNRWVALCLFYRSGIQKTLDNSGGQFGLLQQARAIAIEYELRDILMSVDQNLADYYKEHGKPEKALESLTSYYENRLKEASSENDNALKSKELEFKLKEKEHQFTLVSSQKNFYQVLTVLGILIAVITIVLLYKVFQGRRKDKEAAEKDRLIAKINIKNQQLENDLLQQKMKTGQMYLSTISQHNSKIEDFLYNLKEKLSNLQRLTREEINETKLHFFEILNGQDEIRSLETFSSNENIEFFNKVKQHYSGISPSDISLLSKLMTGNTSKQIAESLKITPESVDKKRYRLRKKLKMHKDESFQDFYYRTL